MIPTSFDESNGTIDKPPDMSRDECDALSIFNGLTSENRPVIVSCWKPTKAELEEIERTGRVWVLIYGGGMPPIAITGFSPFG